MCARSTSVITNMPSCVLSVRVNACVMVFFALTTILASKSRPRGACSKQRSVYWHRSC